MKGTGAQSLLPAVSTFNSQQDAVYGPLGK
jgi:hypothetical protein